VICRNVGHDGSDFILHRCRQRVANIFKRVSKLCTEKPSAARREVFFLSAEALHEAPPQEPTLWFSYSHSGDREEYNKMKLWIKECLGME
jgi:hypothetical protein